MTQRTLFIGPKEPKEMMQSISALEEYYRHGHHKEYVKRYDFKLYIMIDNAQVCIWGGGDKQITVHWTKGDLK